VEGLHTNMATYYNRPTPTNVRQVQDARGQVLQQGTNQLAGQLMDLKKQEDANMWKTYEVARQNEIDRRAAESDKEKMGWLRDEQAEKQAQKEALSKYKFDPLSVRADEASAMEDILAAKYEDRGGTEKGNVYYGDNATEADFNAPFELDFSGVITDPEVRAYRDIKSNLLPTQEQAQRAITRDLLNIYKDPIKAKTAAEALASDYTSKASIQAAEDKKTKQVTDALKQQVQQNKDIQDQKQKTYDNYIKRLKTMSTLNDVNSKTYKSTNKKNYYDAKKWVKEANVSPIFAVAFSDEDEALKVLDYAEAQGIPAGAALKVLQNKFQGTPGGAYFGDEKFRLAEAKKELETMASKTKGDSSYKRQLTSLLPEPPSALPASALTYKTPVSRTVEEIQYDQGIGRLEKLLGKNQGSSTTSKTIKKVEVPTTKQPKPTKNALNVTDEVKSKIHRVGLKWDDMSPEQQKAYGTEEEFNQYKKEVEEYEANAKPLEKVAAVVKDPKAAPTKEVLDSMNKVADEIANEDKKKQIKALTRSIQSSGLRKMTPETKREWEVLKEILDSALDTTAGAGGYLYDVYQRNIGQPFLKNIYNPTKEALIRSTH
jgi:hypothetical protein